MGKVVRPEKITAHTHGQHMPMSALCYSVNLKQMIIKCRWHGDHLMDDIEPLALHTIGNRDDLSIHSLADILI